MEIGITNVAAAVRRDRTNCLTSRIALGSVSPIPMRAVRAESILSGSPWTQEKIREASEMAAQECQPISDVRATDWYRRRMVKVLVRRALDAAWEQTELKWLTEGVKDGQGIPIRQ